MEYLSVADTAKKWQVAERTVRNYCAKGQIEDAFLDGKTWKVPADAARPERSNKSQIQLELLPQLRLEKEAGIKGGIYHKVQIELTYNSNHMEGSKLTHEQTRFIYETNTIGLDKQVLNVDDILETTNHFRCIDMLIEQANNALSESFIKHLHAVLKSNTSDARKKWFAVGNYKKLPNEVGGRDTALPEEVAGRMKKLLADYNKSKKKTLVEIINFHYQFEAIHPFQDGNGRVGRLIMFKECLRNNIVPFIIDDEFKLFYYRGLHEWTKEQGYLLDTCLAAQDNFKKYLDYFRITYNDK